MYTVITENDESQWDDDTGVLYHFPRRYEKFLKPGTSVIYYKGKIKDKKYSSKRLSDAPHYFGTAKIGKIYSDKESAKGDLFALIEEFIMFSDPVMAKTASGYFEKISENRKFNYWRDGVRPINKEIYESIVGLEFCQPLKEESAGSSIEESKESDFESLKEGSQRLRYVTVYERNPRLRRQAIAIHGLSCLACNFNFELFYGEYAKGFIHIHHVVPVSEFETSKLVNPEIDLVPLCANCHAIVHKRKDKTLTIEELKALVSNKFNKPVNWHS